MTIPIFLDGEPLQRRRDVCDVCEHRIKTLGVYRCGLCGCVILSKTLFKQASCPARKWPTLE